MRKISLNHAYKVRFAGQPSTDVTDLPVPQKIAVHPVKLPYLKPRLLVKEGDSVQIGTPLFCQKKDSRVQFVSPGSGKIERIVFGDRRVLEAIVIALDESESAVEFPRTTEEGLERLTRDDVTTRLLEGGLWGSFRCFPFRKIPSPDETAPSIYVSLDDDEPFKPKSEVFLAGKTAEFKLGLAVLRKLDAPVVVAADQGNKFAQSELADSLTHLVKGPYPANEPGAILYHNKKSVKENGSWYIAAQEVLAIGEFFLRGQYPADRIVVLGGEYASAPQHFRVRIGTLVSELLQTQTLPDKPLRYIAGGIFTGRQVDGGSHLSYGEYALQIIQEGQESEFLTFMRLGANKMGVSRAFLSAFLPEKAWGGFVECERKRTGLYFLRHLPNSMSCRFVAAIYF